MSLFLSKFQKILYYYIDKHTKIYNQNMECKIKSRPCKVPSGNDFKLYIRVEKPNYETGETIWEPFDLSVCKNITVQLLNEPRNIYIPLEWALDDEDTSKIIANVEGLSLTPGSSYGMQITGIDSDGNNFRWKARGREMFSAVDATNDANLNEDLMDYLDVKVRIGFEYASEIFATKEELNVVSGEVDDLTTQVGDLTTEVGDLDTDVSNLDTKVSGFESAIETNTQNIEANTAAIAQNYATLTQSINSEAQTRSTNDQALQAAITTVDDKFELYYPKTDVYNKTEIDSKVTTINTSIGSEESSRIAADDNLQSQINAKANSADVYNKTSVDYLLADKADKSTTYTKTEVDGLLVDKADSDDVYDKTEVYTKTEVDELIEEGGGTTYTDTILVGKGLIERTVYPQAKFGYFNQKTDNIFGVGFGSVAQTYSTSANFTPLNERGRTFTFVGNYNMETYIGTSDQGFYLNLSMNNANKAYDDNDNEFNIGANYYGYFAATFNNHILKDTIKYREFNNPERNFDINITIEVDPSIPTTTFTLKTTRDIYLTSSPTIFRGNVTRKDALSVDIGGTVSILQNPSSSSTSYTLQEKFNTIETNINSINNTVSLLPTPDILSQTEYDNYLYHDPNKMYVTTEEDLTDYKNEYFTITPLGLKNPIAFGSFRLSINASNFSIEYSKDKITWTSYTSGSWYGFTDLEPVYLRGTGSAYSSSTKFGQFSFTIKNVKISGNIMSLLYGDNFQNQTSLTEYNISFNQLFTGLTEITDASKLILPATSLTNSAYSQMFMNCSNLIYAPKELPATTLTQYCYSGMFENCSKLSHPISLLPSTNGASYCYKGMYKNCILLAKSPSIRLTNGQSDFSSLHLTDEMFYGCTSLKYVEIMANHTSANYGLGSNFLYNVPNKPNSIFVMNGNSKFFTGIPDKWQVVKVTPPTN